LNGILERQRESISDFLSSLDVAEDLSRLINDSDSLLRKKTSSESTILTIRKARLSAFQSLCRIQRGRVPFRKTGKKKSLLEEYDERPPSVQKIEEKTIHEYIKQIPMTKSKHNDDDEKEDEDRSGTRNGVPNSIARQIILEELRAQKDPSLYSSSSSTSLLTTRRSNMNDPDSSRRAAVYSAMHAVPVEVTRSVLELQHFSGLDNNKKDKTMYGENNLNRLRKPRLKPQIYRKRKAFHKPSDIRVEQLTSGESIKLPSCMDDPQETERAKLDPWIQTASLGAQSEIETKKRRKKKKKKSSSSSSSSNTLPLITKKKKKKSNKKKQIFSSMKLSLHQTSLSSEQLYQQDSTKSLDVGYNNSMLWVSERNGSDDEDDDKNDNDNDNDNAEVLFKDNTQIRKQQRKLLLQTLRRTKHLLDGDKKISSDEKTSLMNMNIERTRNDIETKLLMERQSKHMNIALDELPLSFLLKDLSEGTVDRVIGLEYIRERLRKALSPLWRYLNTLGMRTLFLLHCT
jgi:hypothetical protein